MRRWTSLLLGGWLAAAATAAQLPLLPQIQPNIAGIAKPAAPDALPDGAIARLGTLRGARGPTGPVPHTLLYSPDGKLLAGADAQTIRLWDPATGQEVRQLVVPAAAQPARGRGVRGNPIRPNSVAFAPDSKTLAICANNRIQIWDVNAGQPVNDWPAPVSGTLSPALAYAPDGKRLTGLLPLDPGLRRPTITIWNPATGEQVQQVAVGEPGSSSSTAAWVAYSPDGRLFAIATMGRPVLVVEAATGEVRAEWNAAHAAVRGPPNVPPEFVVPSNTTPGALAFAADGRTLYAVTAAGIAAWDVALGRERWRFGAALANSPLSLSADGQLLAVRAADGVRLYEPATGRQRPRVADSITLPNNYAFALAPDGTTLAAIDRYGALRFWDTATGQERNAGPGHAGPVTQLAFAPDSRSLVSTSADRLCVWDVAKHEQRVTLPQAAANPRLRVISPDGRRLAVVGTANSVRVLAVPDGKLVRQLDDVAAGPYGLAFSGDGNTLAVSEGKAVKLWDLTTGTVKKMVEANPNTVTLIALAANGRRLAGVGVLGGLRVWDADSGRSLWEQAAPGFASRSAPVFSPDGTRLAYAGLDGRVRVLDAATGQEVALLEGLTGTASMSPDFSELIGRPVFVNQNGTPPPVTFSPDGRLLVAGGERQVHVWEAATGRLFHTLPGHVGAVDALAFSTDGRLLATGGADATVLLWDATRLAPPPDSPEPPLTETQLTQLWEELAGTDAAKAYTAMKTLAASPRAAVAGLRSRLKPAEAADPQKLAPLLADLDSDRYDRRERATRELAGLADEARPALEKFLAGASSPEARHRAQELIRGLDQPPYAPAVLRQLRAVEVLEGLGTPEARTVLAELAKGADGARLTQEVREALVRLKRQ